MKTYFEELNVKTLFDPVTSDLSVMSDGIRSDVAPSVPNEVIFAREPQPQQLAPLSSPTSRRPSLNFNPQNQLIFGRSALDDEHAGKVKRDVSYKTESEHKRKDNPLTMKDFMLRKRILKKTQEKKLRRSKRQMVPFSAERLDSLRRSPDLVNPFLFAEEIIHKVDLTVNEKGTEGGAATAITLNRSGTNVVFRCDVPFMFLIRHDPTHIPLFYGVVFQPEN